MKKLNIWLIVLALAALACSSVSLPGVGGETAPAGDVPAAGSPAGATGGNSNNPEELDLDDPAVYRESSSPSYSVALDFNFTAQNADGTPLFRQVLGNGQRNQVPPGWTFRFEPNDPAVLAGLGVVEIAQIDGATYFANQTFGCLQTAEYDNPYAVLMDTGGLLYGTARRVETGVSINGVQTDRYELTLDNVDLTDAAGSAVRSLNEGALYLSQSDGSILRVVLAGRGVSELLTGDSNFEGDVRYQWDVTPSTQPFTIQPPAGCPQPGDESSLPYPALADARNITALPGILTYETDASFTGVIDFYKAEMAALGYSLTEEAIFEPVATLSFTDGSGARISVIIGPAASGSGQSVLVSGE